MITKCNLFSDVAIIFEFILKDFKHINLTRLNE